MYLTNKYTRWYYNIIANAQSRTIAGYTEKHHIIPRSLGGTNSKSNLVHLTAREHFICHLLLTKMTLGNDMYKMKYALNMISNIKNIGAGRYTPSSKLYEYVRKCHFDAIKNIWTDEKRTEHAEKISKATLGSKKSEKAKESYRNKTWTEKAIRNRLNNCLANASKRKGTKNPKHGQQIFLNYVLKNKDTIKRIWELFNSGLNRRQISLNLDISWDKVNLAINKKEQILIVMENQNY